MNNFKKIFCVVIALLILCSLCACQKQENNITALLNSSSSISSDDESKANNSSALEDVFDSVSSIIQNTDSDDVWAAINTTSRGTITQSSTSSSTENNEAGNGSTASSNNTTSTASKPGSTTSKHSSTTSKPSSTTQNSSQNQNTSSGNDVGSSSSKVPVPAVGEGVEYDAYEFAGQIMGMATSGDIVYVASKNPNYLVKMEASEGKIIAETNLPGIPDEIKIINNKVMVSIPALTSIKVYDPASLGEVKTYNVGTGVRAFDISGDNIYYSDNVAWSNVWRYSISSGTGKKLAGSFYNPGITINSKLGLVYVHESSYISSTVSAYNLKDWTLDSKFAYQNKGYNNAVRNAVLRGNYFYWGEFKLDAADVSVVKAQYSKNSMNVKEQNGIFYTDGQAVLTSGGLYEAYKGRLLTEWQRGVYDGATVTKADNIVIYGHNYLFIIYSGKK